MGPRPGYPPAARTRARTGRDHPGDRQERPQLEKGRPGHDALCVAAAAPARSALTGNQQVCDHQFQPGFTHWGSFAQYVSIHYADTNLVRLPDELDFVTAASLGCRFVTSYRGIVDQGKVSAGQWVAVHGCGGVGLSAIMIASAGRRACGGGGYRTIPNWNSRAPSVRMSLSIPKPHLTLWESIKEVTGGGAHVSMECAGQPGDLFQLDRQPAQARQAHPGRPDAGRAEPPANPMDKVVANELEILGSHGIQAHRYGAILDLILAGKLRPDKLIRKRVNLEESMEELVTMDQFKGVGISVIDQFD